MEKKIGMISRDVHCPITHEGDGLAAIVSQSVLSAARVEDFRLRDRDVIAVTEPIATRVQEDYASVDTIAANVKEKLGGEITGVMFPILSCNRFVICLRGIIEGAKKVVLMLGYPSNEAGDELVSIDRLSEVGTNPCNDVLSLETYRKPFGENRHGFTGINYVSHHGGLIQFCGAKMEIIFADHPREILKYTKSALTCDIHTRVKTKRILKANGAERVCSLDDIMTVSVDGSGYNEAFGPLGSNKSTEDTVRLFPRSCQPLVQDTQEQILQACGKHMEVMMYGDGALKDPVRKIWGFTDPCVSPVYTPELEGTPSELGLKYLTNNDFTQLRGEGLQKAIEAKVRGKEDNLVGNMASQGTIPRRLAGLIDSLCDLTSDSRDKGTPIVLVQGYFDNFTS